MKVAFVSNYYNHHQSAFSEAMQKQTQGNYTFVETTEFNAARKSLGWESGSLPPFVKSILTSSEDLKFCKNIIDEADVVISGGIKHGLLDNRLKQKKLTFMYSERIYKAGIKSYELLARLIWNYLRYGRYKNLYMLCASAYTAADYAKTGTFKNKNFKWGYFPVIKNYNSIDKIIGEKNPLRILWVGRFINWKHPEAIIEVATLLKEQGIDFEVNIIGSGPLESNLKQMITDKKLDEYVIMAGAMSPESVRIEMEKAGIFVFSSDFNEGWGVVLNEAMNSGCAVVASHAIGATPFLVQDGQNGFIYKSEDINDLYSKVKRLLTDIKLQKQFGRDAYKTIIESWNAEIAAERFIALSKNILDRGELEPYKENICSKAEILKNNWYV